MDVIRTENGCVSGTVIGEYRKSVRIFRGIPYAAPPVKDLRWKPPQPVSSWKGIRECTVYSKIAPQPVMPIFSDEVPMSEDCLYLNVVTPAKNAKAKLPVMVWMHGGGYAMGCGNDKIWNNSRLTQHGIVLVTVNTRLGPLGLLAHQLLSHESPRGVSGNYLLLDLIAALKWVRNNIAAFGGDPDNVTIFGESGGGAKVTNMMSSPLAKGLFHRAICESGTTLGKLSPTLPLKTLEATGEEIFAQLGVDKATDPLKAARELPWQKIIEADQAVAARYPRKVGTMNFILDAAVDGWVLPAAPIDIFKNGKPNSVPLIVCANLGELLGPGLLVIPDIIPAYVQMLETVSRAGFNGYACIFDHVPANWKKEGSNSVHSLELTYVFGDWDNSSGWWPSIAMISRASGAKSVDPELTAVDRRVSEAMMAMWTQFAGTGDPSVPGLIQWPPYRRSEDQYFYITDPLEVKTGFSRIAQE